MQDKPLLSHLTGFRAIAAYAVLFGYFIDARVNHGGVQLHHEFAAVFAYFGMTFFFTLSGFVITYTYYDIFRRNVWHKAAWRFFAARFARLYPLYVFALLLQVQGVVPALYYSSWGERLSFFTLTQSWFNFQHIIFPNAWSISNEMFFYAAFALFMALGSMLGILRIGSFERMRRSAIFLTLAILTALYMAFFCRETIGEALTPYFSHRKHDSAWGWFSYFSPLVRVADFAMGACAARLYMLKTSVNADEARRSAHLTLLAIIMVVFIGIYHSTHYKHETFLFFISQNFATAPLFAYLFYASSTYGGWLKRLGSSRPMIAGGTLSYSLYMMQCVIFFWPFWGIFPRLTSVYPSMGEWIIVYASVFFYMGVVTVISILTYRFIEAPARKFIRRKSHVEHKHA